MNCLLQLALLVSYMYGHTAFREREVVPHTGALWFNSKNGLTPTPDQALSVDTILPIIIVWLLSNILRGCAV